MKRILSGLLLMATLLCLCACSPAQEAENPSLSNPTLGFSFSYPLGWKVVQNDTMIQIVKDDASTVNLTAFEITLAEGQSREDYLSDYTARLSADLKDMKSEREKVSRGSWLSYEYTATHTEGNTYRFLQAFLQQDRRLAVMTLCAPAGEFAEYNKLIESTLSSFSFTEKSAAASEHVSGRLTNPAVEYAFTCPQGWQLIRNDGMIAVKTEDGSTFNTGAFTMTNTVDAIDNYFKEFSSTVGDYQLMGEYQELSPVDGRYPAMRCEYTATVNGTLYRFSHLFVTRAGYIYSFLYTAKDANFALHQEDVNTIFNSITFTKG